MYGPSTSETRHTTYDGVVWLSLGQPARERPTLANRADQQWASSTNRMLTEVERSLADELGGADNQPVAVPHWGG